MANDSCPSEVHDYKVGPGKPPKHTRFKPGQSGNPKGRPKGSQNVKTVLNKVGRESVTGVGRMVSIYDVL